MPNESTPPIRDLPDEIEAAIENYYNAVRRFVVDKDRASYKVALHNLTETIRAALDEAADIAWHDGGYQTFKDTKALRERAERLRRALVTLGADAWMDGHKGDLADNLIPRKGDVLP